MFYNLLIWSLVAFSIVNIISFSYIFSYARNYWNKKSPNTIGKLIHCPMCLGFWVGMVLGGIWYSPCDMIILDGFLGSCVSWLLFLLIHNRQKIH